MLNTASHPPPEPAVYLSKQAMDLFFRHSQKRLHPDRADLARAQEIQEVTQGNPDFRR